MTPQSAKPAISRAEFIALIAMLSSTVAFSIDAMLPALPDIAAAVSPNNPNKAQLVVAAFVIGMGLGTFVSGPLSDAYGRHAIAVGGGVIYTLAAITCIFVPTIETLLAARLIQGLGASGPRVVSLAIIRDLFEGRQMARIVSFVMTVFALTPILAPTLGAGIAWAFGWRAIFVSFALFSFISLTWLLLRQPETLPPEKRRPFRWMELWSGFKEVVNNRQVMLSIGVQTLVFSTLFTGLMTSQPTFDQAFGRDDTFHYWFGAIAAVSVSASVINAMVVVRLGMKRVVLYALIGLLAISLAFLAIQTFAPLSSATVFMSYLVWLTAIFLLAGFGIGNMNAIAMEPMGHIAGMAASIITASATVIGVALAAPASLLFNGTPLPATLVVIGATGVALILTHLLEET